MYSRPNQLFTASMLLIVSVLCALASAHATTFSVTNLDDSGAGSLRQAVLDANAASGADVINFSVTGVITLTTEGLTITDDLELLGPGAMSLSISGNNSNIVFVNSSGVILGISGLTISEGKGDGGSGTSEDSGTIYNYGTLVINNSAVRDSIMSDCYEDGTEWCVAGVVNFGTLTMNNSSVSYNYGAEGISGIVNVGTAMINNSIIEQNSSGDALAGISNHGLLAVKDSTIRDNRGGYGDAGVVNSRFGTLTVDRSTISGNSARCLSGVFNGNEMTINTSTVSNNRGDSGGILNGNNGSLSINASTVYGNTSGDGRECEAGAGISNMPGSTLVIGNTIVAGNNRNTGDLIGPVPADVKGLFVSLGHNLVGNADESSGFGSSGDQLGTLAAPLDPLLGPLQNNGGPTETHALLSGSSAIDMGSNSLLPPHTITDQRGFLRIVNGTVDIGAYEFGDGVLPTVFAVDDGPYVLDEGSALAGHANILDNDTGPEGVPLIPVVVDPPDHASFRRSPRCHLPLIRLTMHRHSSACCRRG
jgi:hypothetical protein